MHVEDLFIKIRNTRGLNFPGVLWKRGQLPFDGSLSDEWSLKFISNVGQYVDANKPLSNKQGAVILKMIDKVRSCLVEYGYATNAEISTMLVNPQYRHEPYESTFVPKEVRHLGGNLLAFRFKKNDEIKDALKVICRGKITGWLGGEMFQSSMGQTARYDWLYKLWIVPVCRFNIREIIALIHKEQFGRDDATSDYLRLARRSFDQPSLCAIHDGIILANVCDDPLLSGWITEVANGVTL
jgi:hypothetical protein